MSKIYNTAGTLMYSDEKLTLKELVEKNKKNLAGANLKGVDLPGADLSEANLRRADLRKAYLARADLSRVDLRESSLVDTDLGWADLTRADLREANLRETNLFVANLQKADLRKAKLEGADLRKAKLEGADLMGADLTRADLRKANLSGAKLDLQLEEGLLQKVAKHALASEDSFNMSKWHSCETTHCIAGWACQLAKNGEELERKYDTQVAGLLLLGVEAHKHFFDSNEEAREFLQKHL